MTSDENDIAQESSKDDVERTGEHTEPRLLCEFCDTSHDATGLLKHVAYSEDESHGSLGSVPEGFHPASAPVLKEGTMQVALPDELRTNVHFHPLCRWCGEKFYLIDNYIEHINGDRGSFDEDLHRADGRQPQRPLLVPFNRNGTVIPTIPPLTELIEDTNEAVAFGGKKRSEPNGSLDPNESKTTAKQERYAPSRTMKEENENVSNDVETSPPEMDGNGSSDDEAEPEKQYPTAVIDYDHKTIENDNYTKDGKIDKVATTIEETVDEKTVKIDGVLLALVDRVVEKEATEYDSRTDLLDTALEEFLGSVITDDQMSFENQITTSRRFDIETDPVLKHLLREIVKIHGEFDSYHEFVQHTLLDYLDIETSANEIPIPNYTRYSFVIERLIQIDDSPYESPSHIVHTALENHLQI